MKKVLMIKLFLISFLVIIPFSLSDKSDNISPPILNDTTVGYYQSTTCKISLMEFYLENIEKTSEIYINNNNYADINCFGKITGVDINNEKYFVSIGTNSMITLLIQSLVWLTLFSFIKKSKNITNFSFTIPLIASGLLTFQHLAESRFYRRTNILFNDEVVLSNLYLLNIFIVYLFISFILIELLKTRSQNLVHYLPFMFLIVGTYSGTNFNFYLLLGILLGLKSMYVDKKLSVFDWTYLIFSLFWITNITTNDYFFDGDKLRGFTNSTFSNQSQFFWVLVIFLIFKGLGYIVQESYLNFELNRFYKNSLISGFCIVIFGIIGANSPASNFVNSYIFGLNKRGMKDLISVDGNTWRGLSASAESIGEYYGFVVLMTAILMIRKEKTLDLYQYLLVLGITFGLFKTNNFASISLLILMVLLLLTIRSNLFLRNGTFFKIGGLVLVVIFSMFIFTNNYEYTSSNLIYESTRHLNFYQNVRGSSDSTSQIMVLEKIKENNVGTILLNDFNYEQASSSYKVLFNLFTQKINIPFLPNLVAILSIIAITINRSEMWSIFIAKYDPSLLESLFGYGPIQLNGYLYENTVRLNVPSYLKTSLFLPHSSIFDLMIYFGIFGILILLASAFKILLKSNRGNIFYLPTVFLIINILKSDSLLYLNSVTLFIFCLLMLNESIKEN
jgi:hypothetical protein